MTYDMIQKIIPPREEKKIRYMESMPELSLL